MFNPWGQERTYDEWKKTEVKVTRKSNTNIVVESKGIS